MLWISPQGLEKRDASQNCEHWLPILSLDFFKNLFLFIACKVKCFKSILFKLWLLFIQYLQYLKLLYFPRTVKKKSKNKLWKLCTLMYILSTWLGQLSTKFQCRKVLLNTSHEVANCCHSLSQRFLFFPPQTQVCSWQQTAEVK